MRAKNGLNVRNVFMKKLFLKGDGVGGDDAACVAFKGGEEGGDEIGITFPDAGAGFHGEGMGRGGGFGDSAGHFLLLGSEIKREFVAFAMGFEEAARFKKAVSRFDGGGSGLRV